MIDLQKRPLSYSSLKEFGKSPKHYMYYLVKPRVTTPAMVMGNVADCLLLEPEKFDKKYIVGKKIDKRTKAGKEEYAKLEEKARGKDGERDKLILDDSMYENAKEMVFNINNHWYAKQLLDKMGHPQRKLQWIDNKTKLPLIGYVDGEGKGKEFIFDLKTSNDASEDSWARQSYNMGYHLQTGVYLLGYKRKYFKFPAFYHIVVENAAPFAVNVFKADDRFINYSKQLAEQLLNRFKHAMDNDMFGEGYEFLSQLGYSQLTIPGYAKGLE